MANPKHAFKHTLNLPQTHFPMKANLSQNEPLRVKKWDASNMYAHIQSKTSNRPAFVFHDGPPYANGSIHIGHLLNKVLKDLVVRSQWLLGNACHLIPGWDCHGLPIEHKVLTELSKEKKEKLASLSKDHARLAIRNECKKYAQRFISLQTDQMKRLLTMADYTHPYLTFQPAYEATVLDVFASMVDAGIVFRQLKPVHWSIANQTALADAELDYQDKTSDSIAVKFLLSNHPFNTKKPVHAVIWTTTPWTLPANLAIAFGETIQYSLVRITDATCLIATDRIAFIQSRVASLEILESVSGDQLKTCVAQHPFMDRASPFYPADFVTTDDGSGLVHIAPGHGTDDYLLGQQHHLATYCPVQADGTYDDTVPDWLQGLSIWPANKHIIDRLQSLDALLFHEPFVHSYPHDWRSKTPVIFRSTAQWFIGVDHTLADQSTTLRELAIHHIENTIAFHPNAGRARLKGMLESRPDWCISRQRAWGLPIPAFQDATGNILLTGASIRAVKTIIQRDGSDAWFRQSPAQLLADYDRTTDSHAPVDFELDSAEKLHDIFDVWFESGSSWKAVLLDRQQTSMADLYLEGSDQHRGWFHLSLLPSLAVQQHAPFKGILTHGFIVDKDGRKMSKSSGNALTVDELLKTYGAEVTRWWVSSLSYDGDIKVDINFFNESGDLYRKIRNTLRFIVSNLYDAPFNHDMDHVRSYLTKIPAESIDAFMVDQTNRFQTTVTQHYAAYEFRDANQAIYQFCNDTLSSIYCTTVKDRLYCDRPDSLRRRRTQYALRYILESLVHCLSPILPHTCDELMESLHDSNAPTIQGAAAPPTITPSVSPKWTHALTIRKTVQKELEYAKQLGIDNSLDAGVNIPISTEIDPLTDDLPDFFGVSRISFTHDTSVSIEDLRHAPCCERSWKRDATVTQRANGALLSDRDYDAIQ